MLDVFPVRVVDHLHRALLHRGRLIARGDGVTRVYGWRHHRLWEAFTFPGDPTLAAAAGPSGLRRWSVPTELGAYTVVEEAAGCGCAGSPLASAVIVLPEPVLPQPADVRVSEDVGAAGRVAGS